jgi:hypothetical protein
MELRVPRLARTIGIIASFAHHIGADGLWKYDVFFVDHKLT